MGSNIFQLKTFGDFIGGQVLTSTPILFIAICSFLYRQSRRAWVLAEEKPLFILSFSLPVFIFFGIAASRNHIEANWPVCAYMSIFLGLSGEWSKETLAPMKLLLRKTWTMTLMVSVVGLSMMAHVVVLMPFWPLTPDLPFLSRIYGWREMAHETKSLVEDPPLLIPAFESYQMASEFQFYKGGDPWVYLGTLPKDHPMYRFRPTTAFPGKGSDLLLVMEGHPRRDLQDLFEKTVELKPLVIQVKGRFVKFFSFTQCYNFIGVNGSVGP